MRRALAFPATLFLCLAFSSAMLIGHAASTPAEALDNHDIASLLGMTWRAQDNICPGVSFDPAPLARKMTPPMSPEAAKGAFPNDFDQGYAFAAASISGDDFGAYCQNLVVDFYGDRRDIEGHVKDRPEPLPGLTIAQLGGAGAQRPAAYVTTLGSLRPVRASMSASERDSAMRLASAAWASWARSPVGGS